MGVPRIEPGLPVVQRARGAEALWETSQQKGFVPVGPRIAGFLLKNVFDGKVFIVWRSRRGEGFLENILTKITFFRFALETDGMPVKRRLWRGRFLAWASRVAACCLESILTKRTVFASAVERSDALFAKTS